jgi:ectoine hydroxylase-related dioxygenase (phytanoyl-CoA dioxygenase family)
MTSHHLTPAERRQIDEDGYIVRERVFDGDEVAEITDACERLVAELIKDRQGKRFNVGSYVFEPDRLTGCTIKWEGDSDVVHGIEPFAHLSPELERWGYDPRFVDPSSDIVGEEPVALFTEKLNLKRPHVGGPNPFHQDFPYWDGYADDATKVMTAVLFLDDASLENGTLQVVPGSHKQGKWQTRTDSDLFGNLELDPNAVADAKTVAVEVPAGSIVFFGAFLVHKSDPNTSDRDRRALLYSYQPKRLTSMIDIERRLAAERASAKA